MNRRSEMIPPSLFHTVSPIQPPPLRGTSFQRKEGVSTRAPSLGRGKGHSEAGLVSFWGGARVLSYNGALETIFFALFHPAGTLSGSLRSPPSPRGEGFVSGKMVCLFLHPSHIKTTVSHERPFLCVLLA